MAAQLKGKRILLGITGSIAAYKSIFLIRLLIKEGADVRVLTSPSALNFVTELSLSTLSKHKVYSGLANNGNWENHVELGLWAELFLIVPATANTIAQMANGICNTMLLACYLSARCPVWLAPAMDVDMWEHPATQSNIERLKSYGHRILPVGEGELASGLQGKGRVAEPEQLLKEVLDFFQKSTDLQGLRVLITGGPTVEAIDPVRYISNHSSGKMANALASALYERGAEIVYINGPAQVYPQEQKGLRRIDVQSAEEMYQAALQAWPSCQLGILAAAVSDYAPAQVAEQKIKKQGDEMQILLRKNKDIAASLGASKKEGQLLMGFALETERAREHAAGKLERKKLDIIVLNRLGDAGAGFGYDSNKIAVLDSKGQWTDYPLASKEELAKLLVEQLAQLWKTRL